MKDLGDIPEVGKLNSWTCQSPDIHCGTQAGLALCVITKPLARLWTVTRKNISDSL